MINHIKPETLRTFITVADCGTLTEASLRLGRTVSAISMTLKQLGEQLGAKLFETDRKSTLTPLGHYVLAESRRALADFDDSMQAILRYAQGETGRVRLAMVPSIAMQLLPEVAQGFQAQFPEVRLELRDMDSASVAEAVRNGNVDFGIASLAGASHDLLTELVLEDAFGVICLPAHPLAQCQHRLDWADLQAETLITNGLCRQIQTPAFTELARRSHVHVHNTATLLAFVSAGVGITLLPRMAIPARHGLLFLPLTDPTAVRHLYLLQHHHHLLAPAALAFRHQLLQALKAIATPHPD